MSGALGHFISLNESRFIALFIADNQCQPDADGWWTRNREKCSCLVLQCLVELKAMLFLMGLQAVKYWVVE